ncbi:hypothetical protein PG994_003551 [Apiospora phragmitis]|uniref:Uncharacterized protein n=1 Tax=Apiospora phragmitis TaxID=2905665 RepID=A0ABR1W292_9PEZI
MSVAVQDALAHHRLLQARPPALVSLPRDFEKLAAMQAQAQYNNNTNGRPSTSSKFDSHDDFYDFLDSNRGGSGGGGPPPNSNNPNAAAMAMQQGGGGSPNVQRPIPINGTPDQSRPPVTRGTGGAQMRSRPPLEMLVDKHREQRERDRRQQQLREQQLQQQQQGASPTGPSSARKPIPGGPRSPSSDHNSPWRAGSGAVHTPQQQQQQARPTSSDSASSGDGRPLARTNTAAGAALGNAIQRLKSPSVMDCVLSPLESKVTEYLGFMTQEEDAISRLDTEIALLQSRKAEAEARHAEAKAKHDDYRRQYADVERALRGDAPPMPGMRHAATATTTAPTTTNGPPTTRELQQQQREQQQAGMGRPSVHNPQHDGRHIDDDMDVDDYEDEDDYQQRRPGSRRIMSQQSFGRASQQGKKSRFRFSLFGGDK